MEKNTTTTRSKSAKSSSRRWLVTSLFLLLVALWIGQPQPDLKLQEEIVPLARTYASSSSDSSPLQGVRIVITGATSGIGYGLVKQLSGLGATVIALGRSPNKLQALREEFSDCCDVVPVKVQLGDLESVRDASEEIASKFDRIDMLINNAGIHYTTVPDRHHHYKSAPPLQTPQGIDLSFGVNYVSHFLLSEKMLPLLYNSTYSPTVVQISSSFHWGVDGTELIPNNNRGGDDNSINDMPLSAVPGSFSGIFATQKAYASSKLAQIWHARALQRRHPKIRVKSICPCWVGTGIGGDFIGMFLSKIAFPNEGFGIKSALHAALDTTTTTTTTTMNDASSSDYYTNSFVTQLFDEYPRAQVMLTNGASLRDVTVAIFAFFLMPLQKFAASVQPRKSSPESYLEEHQEQLYEWSYETVQPFL